MSEEMIEGYRLNKYTGTPVHTFISDPQNWKDFPFLEMHRVVDGAREYACLNVTMPEIMLCGRLNELRQIARSTGSTKGIPRHEYDSLEECMDEGWTVDLPEGAAK